MSNVLLIFIKNPRLGQVKTRLAQAVGEAEALRIYHILLEMTRQVALEVAVQRRLFYSDKIENKDNWSEEDFEKRVQQGSDLGARMANAFRQAFEAGASRVVIIGSDCPGLNSPVLEHAFAQLEHIDFVLGPSFDGGYYLLGMRSFEPSVFQDIAWSTDSVRSATLKRIRSLGKTCFLLPMLSDIDTAEDWYRYQSNLLNGRD